MAIGDPRPRVEDARLLAGRGLFVDDIERSDELTMVLVRSLVPAGRIVGIDDEAAGAMPGVAAIWTAADLAADGVGALRSAIKIGRPDGSPMLDTPCPLLASEHVQFAGDPVAMVLAEDRAAALDAAEAVVVDIDARRSLTNVRDAAQPDAPVVWPGAPDNIAFRFERGDRAAVDAAFAAADQVVKVDMDITRVSANPVEPRGVLAVYDPDSGRSTLWTGTQVPHRYAAAIAGVLGIPQSDLHMPAVDIGGGFGMRNTASREAALAVWASRRLERPVRWIAARSEGFLADPHGRDRHTTAELALDEDGKFAAVRVRARAALGGYIAPTGLISVILHIAGIAGVYRIPAIHFAIDGVMTNTQPTTPYRGAGRPEATYTIERLIDVAADKLGLDRREIRARNMLTPAELPCTTALGFHYDCGDFPAALRRACDAADWDGFEARRSASAHAGLLRGIGLAMAIEGAGGPPGIPTGECAEMQFDSEGRLTVSIGSGDSGQGHRTTFGQIAGGLLGIDPDRIRVLTGDTDLVKDGFGSVGSRTVMAVGTAVDSVARMVIEQGRAIAGAALEADVGDIEFRQGAFWVAGTDRHVTLSELAARNPDDLCARGAAPQDDTTYPNGCHICEVEIDPETGACTLDRYTVVDDVGTVINPLLMKGQIHGGLAQGIGQALMERIVHDDAGQLVTGSFLDYAMPRAGDLPSFDIRSNPVPTSTNPLGAKGAGEAGTVGALPAVVSAVCDALRPCGVTHLDMPATPARIWAAIRQGTD